MAFYTSKHLLIIGVCLCLPTLWALSLKKSQTILKKSIFLLSFVEIGRIIWLISTHDFHLNRDLSLQLCFTYILVGLWFLKTGKDFLLSYLGAFGVLFGLAAIILSDPNPFWSFNVLECYFYHSLMIFIGIYILKHYQINFSFKSIQIIWAQMLLGVLGNLIIGNKANYVFLNSLLFPNYHLPYAANVEAFNLPVFGGYSINHGLLILIHSLGIFYYTLLLLGIITGFSSLWLYLMSKIKTRLKK